MSNRASAETHVAPAPNDARAAVERAFARLGWPARAGPDGAIVAVWTSPVFRFRDDLSVEVSPDGAGSRVRVRSASRVGRYDFGRNAKHIREFLAALRSELRTRSPDGAGARSVSGDR